MCDELRESFALLPRVSDPSIWISKPSESRVKKFIGGRRLPTAALSVEGPSKDKLRGAIVFSSHPSKPMVDKCGLSGASPGKDCNDVDVLVCPSTIQKSNILLATENVASCNG